MSASSLRKNTTHDKENIHHSSFSLSSTLNHCMSRKALDAHSQKNHNLIQKQSSVISDSRIKLIMESKEEYQKMYEKEKQKSRLEIKHLRKRLEDIESRKQILQLSVIEEQGKNQGLQKKLKNKQQQINVLEQNFKRLNAQNEDLMRKSEVSINLQPNKNSLFSEEEFKKIKLQLNLMTQDKQNEEKRNRKLQQKIKQLQKQLKEQKNKISQFSIDKQQDQSNTFCTKQQMLNLMQVEIEQIREQWKIQIQQKQNRNVQIEDQKRELVENIAKLQMKTKFQQQELQYRDKNMSKMQSTIEQLTHKLSHSMKQIEAAGIQFKRQTEEHERIVKKMQKMFKQEITLIVNKHEFEVKNIQKSFSQDLSSKIDEEVSFKNQHIEQNLRIIEELQTKNEKWQSQYQKIVQSRDKLQFELSALKIQMLKLRTQLETDVNSQYEEEVQRLKTQLSQQSKQHQQLTHALQLEINKNQQYISLIECYEQKLAQEKCINEKDSKLLKSLEEAYSEKQKQLECEVDQLRKTINQKNMEFQETVKAMQQDKNILEAEIECLENQNKKWKDLRQQSNQEIEDLKRQNRKVRKQRQQQSQQRHKSLSQQSQQELTIQSLQSQKKSLIQNHQHEVNAIKSQYQIEMNQFEEKKIFIEKNVRSQTMKEMKEIQIEQINIIKRRNQEECRKYEEKIKELENITQEVYRDYDDQSKVFQNKNREIKTLREEIRELQGFVEREKIEKQAQKVEVSRLKSINEELRKKNIEQKNNIEQQNYELTETQNKLHKAQALIIKHQHQLTRLKTEYQNLQKQKWQIEDKNIYLTKNLTRLQNHKKQIQEQLLQVTNDSKNNQLLNKQNKKLSKIIREKNQEIESLISALKNQEGQKNKCKNKFEHYKEDNNNKKEQLMKAIKILEEQENKYINKIQELQKSVHNLQYENRMCKKQIQESNEQKNRTTEQLVKTLKNTIQNKERQNLQLKQKNNFSIIKNQKYQKQLINCKQQVKSLTNEQCKTHAELQQAKNTIKFIKIQKQILEDKIKFSSHSKQKKEDERKQDLAQSLSKFDKQNRVQIYRKICDISTDFFNIQVKESESEFLNTLCFKLKMWVEYTTELKDKLKKYHSFDNYKEEELYRTKGQHLQENLNLQHDYDIVYRKYLKYKEAYLSCRSKIQKQRDQALQDQIFTQEIITHCKTIIKNQANDF